MASEKSFENKIKAFLKQQNYSVNESGEVFRDGQRLKPTRNKNGYMSVELWDGGKRKRVYVHRLVAETFIPNPEEKREVNHKDGNKQNNCVENLEWCTSGENKKHAYKKGLKVPSSQKLSLDDVRYIRRNETESRKELAERFNVSYFTICNVIYGRVFKGVE